MTAAFFMALLLTTAGDRMLVDRIVAVVNDDVITLSELNRAALPALTPSLSDEKRAEIMKNTLDQLIADKLLEEQVREAKIEVTEPELDRAVEDILRQNKITRSDLEQAITSRGMSLSQYREELERQLIRLKVVDLKVRSRVVISENDIRADYERETAIDKKDELLKLRHLFFRWGEGASSAERAKVIERARTARGRIEKGEDFARVAKDISEGPTAASGGELGEVSKQGLLPELARAVGTLKPGQLSPPIETDNGVHVVEVVSVRAKDSDAFEAAKNRIYQRLYQQEVERQMKLWIEELKQGAAVDVRL